MRCTSIYTSLTRIVQVGLLKIITKAILKLGLDIVLKIEIPRYVIPILIQLFYYPLPDKYLMKFEIST